MVKNLVDGIKAWTLSQCQELKHYHNVKNSNTITMSRTQHSIFYWLIFEMYQTDLDFVALKFEI